MSILYIKELEASLSRRDERINQLEQEKLDLLARLIYLRDCIEEGREPAMGTINAAITKAKGAVCTPTQQTQL